MQNRFAVHRENRLKSNDVVSETSSREQLDSVEISDEAVRQQNENASELSEETCAKIQEAVKNATTVMDQFNAMSGYRGTSFESVALLEASRFALENVKNTIVPESQRSDFGKLIDEYVP